MLERKNDKNLYSNTNIKKTALIRIMNKYFLWCFILCLLRWCDSNVVVKPWLLQTCGRFLTYGMNWRLRMLIRPIHSIISIVRLLGGKSRNVLSVSQYESVNWVNSVSLIQCPINRQYHSWEVVVDGGGKLEYRSTRKKLPNSTQYMASGNMPVNLNNSISAAPSLGYVPLRDKKLWKYLLWCILHGYHYM